MGLTKIGEELTKEGNYGDPLVKLKALGRFGKYLGGKAIGLMPKMKSLKVIPAMISVLGSDIVNHPKTALWGLGSAAYIGGTLPQAIDNHLAHIDPNQHFTVASNISHRISPISKDPNFLAQMAMYNRSS